MRNYERQVLATKTSEDMKKLYEAAATKTGREYNRAVSGAIIDDMLSSLDDQQSLDFLPHIPVVLPLIQSGMFYTASEYLKTVNFSARLDKIKEELIKCLMNADDTQV